MQSNAEAQNMLVCDYWFCIKFRALGFGRGREIRMEISDFALNFIFYTIFEIRKIFGNSIFLLPFHIYVVHIHICILYVYDIQIPSQQKF